MNKKELDSLIRVFKFYPEIKLVYFFGSKAKNESGPLSDYDLAFYLDERDRKRIFEIKFRLQDEISRLLKTDKVDIIMLNITESPELKYNIIKEGKLIYEKEPFRIIIEPKILNEYFDFHDLLLRHGLTRA
jgi:predicted nucleotidyltransferase